MTIADAALALGLGRSTVYELIGRGELEVVHVGRSARVPAAALQTLIERLRAGQIGRDPERTVA
jgi:excisionase family DNA binding protein